LVKNTHGLTPEIFYHVKKPFSIEDALQIEGLNELEYALVLSGNALMDAPSILLKRLKIQNSVPLGCYLKPDKSETSDNIAEFDFVVVAHGGFKHIKNTIRKNKIVVSFPLKTVDINNHFPGRMIKRLRDYFAFASDHPEITCGVECETDKILDIQRFNNVLYKLGITAVIVPYKKNRNDEKLFQCRYLASEGSDEVGDDNLLKRFIALRKKVDDLDKKIVAAIGQRTALIELMGRIKKQNDLQLFEPGRWNSIKKSISRTACVNGLDDELIQEIYELIHLYALKKMMEISFK